MSRLTVLVADADAQAAIEGLLTQPEALGIRAPMFVVRRHSGRDPGVWNGGIDLLRLIASHDDCVLVLFDLQGSRQEALSAEALEESMEDRLHRAGWNRAGAIAIDPELEVWVWSDSPNVARVLGMGTPEYDGLRIRNAAGREGKPLRPKELMESALRAHRIQKSPSNFAQLARTVSFERCSDRAFLKLKSLLRTWFPA